MTNLPQRRRDDQPQGVSPAGRPGQVQVGQITHYSGPLPSPEALEHYDRMMPGLANRIVTMTEESLRHRHKQEDRIVAGNVRSQTLGQWFAFLLSAFVIGVAALLIYDGKVTEGLATIFTDLAALVGLFVYARHNQKVEREQRRKELEAMTR